MERQRHSVLVHGAWCWYKVATLLKSTGYEVTALDMAASAVHPKGEEKARSMILYVGTLDRHMMVAFSLPASKLDFSIWFQLIA
ncbi:hypothetical protein Peur_050341 [Populus x canadensis]